eukprot:92300_1
MALAKALFIAFIISISFHEYEAQSFDSKTTTVEILDKIQPHLTGKLAIVTGATSGIGLETVRVLAMVDCKVIMAVRNYDKAVKVKQDLINTISNNPQSKTTKKNLESNLIPLICDLDSFQSIYDFAKQVIKIFEQPIDYLFNNAGIMALQKYTETIDGYERQIGVNHLGHYYLTRLLLSKLTHARVITVSSKAHVKAVKPIDTAIEMMQNALSNKDAMKIGYDPWKNYGISKSFNILFARYLQRRVGYKGLMSVSLHPGVIKSGLQVFLTDAYMESLKKRFDKNIEQGAATQIWCALMPKENLYVGGYYDDCQIHNDRLR